MSSQIIPHNFPTLGRNERIAADKAIKSNWISQGIQVEKFENEFCEFLGIPSGHAVAVSSGSAALYIGLVALEANTKRVAIPVYGCNALGDAVKLAGGKLAFVDCLPGSPNFDSNLINVSEPEIVVKVSTFGIPAPPVKNQEIKVISDGSQALGATSVGKKIGTEAEIGVFSFATSKLLTSGGQGGMIVSTSKDRIEWVRDFRRFDAREDGLQRFNLQMTDIQAAIGRVQLKKLKLFLEKRDELFSIYKSYDLPLVESNIGEDCAVKYRAVVRTPSPQKLIDKLKLQGINSIIPYSPMELQNHGIGFAAATEFATSTVSIPLYPKLSKRDAHRIAQIAVKELG